MAYYSDTLATTLGLLEVQANDTAITAINFVEQRRASKPNAHCAKAIAQLQEYFAGTRRVFDLALNAKGTEFQQQVWQALSTIDYGACCSYGDIARQIANPKAVRAVGAANGKNPISIVVPCHRVIGSNGTLTGYASGLERKQWLLAHEAKHASA